MLQPLFVKVAYLDSILLVTQSVVHVPANVRLALDPISVRDVRMDGLSLKLSAIQSMLS